MTPARPAAEGPAEATPDQIAAAWRVFRGDRTGVLLGPGPGFREAINAALALSPTDPSAAALREELAEWMAHVGEVNAYAGKLQDRLAAAETRAEMAERALGEALAALEPLAAVGRIDACSPGTSRLREDRSRMAYLWSSGQEDSFVGITVQRAREAARIAAQLAPRQDDRTAVNSQPLSNSLSSDRSNTTPTGGSDHGQE